MAGKKPKPLTAESDAAPEAKRATTDNPLVFISHDSRDGDLAEAFANLLTDASGGILKSFRSSDKKGTAGIEFGDEWYRAIMKKLDDATDVVALLTARSINRPWILYEAGVAKGKLETTVLGLALGVPLGEAVAGPFAQFQNSGDDEDSITKLVLQLIRRHPHADPREEAVRRQVQAFLQKIGELLKDRKKEPASSAPKADETSVAKLFEEVKVLVRDVPDRVAHQLDHDPRIRRKRKRRFNPRMIDEIMHHPAFREGPDAAATGILVVTSLFRDDYPWLYELGLDLYRTLSQGSASAVERARERFMRAIEAMHHPRMMHDMIDGPEDEDAFMMMRHFVHSLERLIESARPRRVSAAKAAEAEKEKLRSSGSD